MIDLGDPWPNLSVTTYNAAGVAQDATLVVLTVTLPDGTTATPTVTAAGSGVYTAAYTPTLPGRYTARWVATGTNASAFTDSIDVDEAATGIVSLADAKKHLNKSATVTTDDEELRGFIDAATDYIEGQAGPVVRRTIIKTVTPVGGYLFLNGPAISLTTMVGAYGYTDTYTVGSYYLDTATGMVRGGPGVSITNPVTVTYVAGRAIVPAGIIQAALDYIKWLWESQRGSTGLPLPGGELDGGVPATVPYRIVQALEPYRVPAVA